MYCYIYYICADSRKIKPSKRKAQNLVLKWIYRTCCKSDF